MEIAVKIPASYIVALKYFAATKDVRRYINGINLEIYPDRIIGVATEGCILGAFCIKTNTHVTKPIKDVIIPIEVLSGVKKTSFRVVFEIGSIQEGASFSRDVKVSYDGTTFYSYTPDSKYVNWRGVVPKSFSGETAQFDVDLLNTVAKAKKVFSKSSVLSIVHNGESPSFTMINPEDFFALILPVKSKGFPLLPPDWVYENE